MHRASQADSCTDRRGSCRGEDRYLGHAPKLDLLAPETWDERIQLVTNSYIIPNMFARAVTNEAKPKDAILWAETEIKRMVRGG